MPGCEIRVKGQQTFLTSGEDFKRQQAPTQSGYSSDAIQSDESESRAKI